ncbi:hypothetical protein GIB67_037373 [Kingdonia uniflora]|uniref:AFG1-like ATPase n=1 Tax=Kingdonia uniflora TaxID=39325 RepID=A0A7J7M8F4_9MAGN|nr:hypothetical protein GIB67_037373 [Kingdonia uniflora]
MNMHLQLGKKHLITIYAGPLTLYKSLADQGKLQHDPHHERVAIELQNLLGRLEQYEKDMEQYHVKLMVWEKGREDGQRELLMDEAERRQQGDVWTAVNKERSKFIERWIIRKRNEIVEPGVGKWVSYLNRERKLDSLVGRRPIAPPAPKGLYLYGNVGSGKTMLMDMFYAATEGIVRHRRRFHFHEALHEINENMHKIWKNQVEEKTPNSSISGWIMNLPFDNKVKEWLAGEERYKKDVQMKNILPAVADKFLVDRKAGQKGASILCFDEIQTVDVFAIVALSGIVSRLLSTGTVLVATSNRAPEDLNQDGMQRGIFLKFIAKLEEHCQIVLVGGDIDYRRLIGNRETDQKTLKKLIKLTQEERLKSVEESTALLVESNKMVTKQLEVMLANLRSVYDFGGDGRFVDAIEDEVEIGEKKIVENARINGYGMYRGRICSYRMLRVTPEFKIRGQIFTVGES